MDIQKGDRVEILIPEFTKGTTGTVMRSCSNDCVVVAIDDMPRFQCRVNISRYLVRKAVDKIPAVFEEPAVKPAVIVNHDHNAGTSHFYTRNTDAPAVCVDWKYESRLLIDETYPELNAESVEDLVVSLRAAARAVMEDKREDVRS